MNSRPTPSQLTHTPHALLTMPKLPKSRLTRSFSPSFKNIVNILKRSVLGRAVISVRASAWVACVAAEAEEGEEEGDAVEEEDGEELREEFTASWTTSTISRSVGAVRDLPKRGRRFEGGMSCLRVRSTTRQ